MNEQEDMAESVREAAFRALQQEHVRSFIQMTAEQHADLMSRTPQSWPMEAIHGFAMDLLVSGAVLSAEGAVATASQELRLGPVRDLDMVLDLYPDGPAYPIGGVSRLDPGTDYLGRYRER